MGEIRAATAGAALSASQLSPVHPREIHADFHSFTTAKRVDARPPALAARARGFDPRPLIDQVAETSVEFFQPDAAEVRHDQALRDLRMLEAELLAECRAAEDGKRAAQIQSRKIIALHIGIAHAETRRLPQMADALHLES